ncbi:MAG: cysteine--tRNA ligase [Candidatus Fraserbacteria bacterium RBG_16_55_9]|uniref:Cysteine--tRNA ligase n=1 Tax=Fraserbacteria sp. (strain RBG_16_55_9) TaxID=1817864 RepID=A0A1F5UVM1_FRAXR|nr:MAG: cysteine--tRNA ligase [Candidatus Fraserbacteria bacterium RBG_16_55_9]
MYDALRRYLEYRGYQVLYVQNITDVDDKIINRASSEKMTSQQVAEKYTQAYFEDLERLGIQPANRQPKATENISAMIEFVQALIEKGYAYEVDGDVYFHVKKFTDYGKLSGKPIDELQAGARVEVDERKENALDFALWKSAKPGEPHWTSPWGEGRPGWHLECSVMSMGLLGETFDIHGGGTDLIFPHHENEAAQSEAATGKPFVRYWVHNELLRIGGEKMSKSLSNFEYARDVIAKYGKEAVRYFYLSKHYRTPISFTHESMADAKRAVERVYHLLEEIEYELERRNGNGSALDKSTLTQHGKEFLRLIDQTREEYLRHLDDDFNTAGALGVIFELIKEANVLRQEIAAGDLPLLKLTHDLIRALGRPLGLFQESPWRESKGEMQGELVQLLVDLRHQLRIKKEFQLADQIRSRLKELGIELKDKGEETIWSYEG